MRTLPRSPSCLAILALVAAGCGATGSPTPATPTATPPVPTAIPTVEALLPPFTCDTGVTQPGSVPTALMSGLAAANTDGVGRIELTFRPAGNVAAVPEVTVRPADPPFTMDPSGLPLTVAGSSYLQVVLQGGTALDANLVPTFEGPFDVTLDGSPIVEMKRAGDFEAVSTFIVGLSGPACFRILPPDGSSHLTIEIQEAQ